ncbi:class 1 isoprenoid biosynthesis enzyme [Streptomyces sp. NPDC046939]|uniref:class 1 isoprenoid biosynthesis enzyme n=1 Tax=Streptomyces sp. NPDC046939 TaxID=3155376 RepID=UPI00340C99C8
MHSSPELSAEAETMVARASGQVHAYLDELLSDYRPRHAALGSALRQLVTRGRPSPHELSLPLLVHAARTGTAEPAVPVAAVHALWWRAANTFDDVTDTDSCPRMYGLPSGVALTAALECGWALPLRALSALDAPARLRRGLRRDYLAAWTAASNGQLGDLLGEPSALTPDAVLAVYRDKSGSVYAMACTMAARLAAGQDESPEGRAVIEGWGRFGHLLGVLAQFRNDEDDLRGEDCEDLRNKTATYLLVHLLHSAPEARRREACALLTRSPASAAGRHRLRAMMLEPTTLSAYHAYVARLRREAHALLDRLAPAGPFTAALRDRVAAETRHLPSHVTAYDDGRGSAS